jgi:hypothetical protein
MLAQSIFVPVTLGYTASLAEANQQHQIITTAKLMAIIPLCRNVVIY